MKFNFATILQDTFEEIRQYDVEDRKAVITWVVVALELLQQDSVIKIRPTLEHATQLFGMLLEMSNEHDKLDHHDWDALILAIAKIVMPVLSADKHSKVCHAMLYVDREITKAVVTNCLRQILILEREGIYTTVRRRGSESVRQMIRDAVLSPENLIEYLALIENPRDTNETSRGFSAVMQAIQIVPPTGRLLDGRPSVRTANFRHHSFPHLVWPLCSSNQ
jgi:hypothetical protein